MRDAISADKPSSDFHENWPCDSHILFTEVNFYPRFTYLPNIILNYTPNGQYLLSSCLLSTNLKIKISRTIVLPVVLYGCETLSITLKEGV